MPETLTVLKVREMSATAQVDLRTYAGLKWPAESHKARILRLTRQLGWGHRRTRAIYNGEQGVSLRANEFAALEALRGEQAENVRSSQAEYRALEARIAALEELFRVGDQEHYEPFMDALRSSAFGPRDRS